MDNINLTFTGLSQASALAILTAATGAGGAAAPAPSAASPTATGAGTPPAPASAGNAPPAPPASTAAAPPPAPSAPAGNAPPAAPSTTPSPSNIVIPDDWKAYYATTPATAAMVMEKMNPYGAQFKAAGVKALFDKAGYEPKVPSLSQDGLNTMHFLFSAMQPA